MPASSSSQIAAGPKIHQLWQAVILKPFKLQECIFHFWKPLIFSNLVSAGQDHSYVLNTRFWLQKRSTFHRACVIGVYILFSMTVLLSLKICTTDLGQHISLEWWYWWALDCENILPPNWGNIMVVLVSLRSWEYSTIKLGQLNSVILSLKIWDLEYSTTKLGQHNSGIGEP